MVNRLDYLDLNWSYSKILNTESWPELKLLDVPLNEASLPEDSRHKNSNRFFPNVNLGRIARPLCDN